MIFNDALSQIVSICSPVFVLSLSSSLNNLDFFTTVRTKGTFHIESLNWPGIPRWKIENVKDNIMALKRNLRVDLLTGY